jgi:hypothetical protein
MRLFARMSTEFVRDTTDRPTLHESRSQFGGERRTAPVSVTRSKLKTCSRGLSAQRPTSRPGKSVRPVSRCTVSAHTGQGAV